MDADRRDEDDDDDNVNDDNEDDEDDDDDMTTVTITTSMMTEWTIKRITLPCAMRTKMVTLYRRRKRLLRTFRITKHCCTLESSELE